LILLDNLDGAWASRRISRHRRCGKPRGSGASWQPADPRRVSWRGDSEVPAPGPGLGAGREAPNRRLKVVKGGRDGKSRLRSSCGRAPAPHPKIKISISITHKISYATKRPITKYRKNHTVRAISKIFQKITKYIASNRPAFAIEGAHGMIAVARRLRHLSAWARARPCDWRVARICFSCMLGVLGVYVINLRARARPCAPQGGRRQTVWRVGRIL
jgi:hypothetical protein